ncbi:MAG TPA: FUSC family protein, partial [Variovorax sp.]
ALIILGAGDLPGHSALQVAALRVGQILIGVTVAMGIALASSRHRADARFRQGSATLLQRLGRQMQQARAEPNEAELENAGAAVRSAIDRLSALAASADRESRLFRRRALSADPRFHRKLAGLTGRIVQDAGLLNRVLRVQPAADQLADEAVRASGAALAAVAECLAGGGRPDLGALARMAADARSSGSGALLAAPLHLLLGDLQRLDALLGKP